MNELDYLPCIKVWPFNKAPQHLRALSNNGGDEDWIAFIPKSLVDSSPMFLEAGTSFGCCDVQEIEIEGGEVRIGSHA